MILKNSQRFWAKLLLISVIIPYSLAYAQHAPVSDGTPEIDQDLSNQHWQIALNKLDQYIKSHPNNVQAQFKRATTLARLQKFDQAITQFQALIQKYPELPEPYNNLAVIYAQQNRLDDAYSMLKMAIKASPNYPLAYENLADINLLLAQKNYLQAQKMGSLSAQSKQRLQQIQKLFNSSNSGINQSPS